MSVEAVAREIVQADRVFCLTGAGISVPSGIPDFRSAGGLWEEFPPQEYATIEAFRADPSKVWEMNFAIIETIRGVEPNPAHVALARLEEAGRLDAVATQNIDGLHQRAGSRVVHELHGGGRRLRCLECGEVEEMPDELPRDQPPRCAACDAILKPDVVYFGEMLPPAVLRAATEEAEAADVCLVVGTSAEVYPAALLPRHAAAGGATICEFNLGPTALTRAGRSDHLVEGSVDETLPALADAVRAEA